MTITIFYNTEGTLPLIIENVTKTTLKNNRLVYEPNSTDEGIDITDTTIDNIVTA